METPTSIHPWEINILMLSYVIKWVKCRGDPQSITLIVLPPDVLNREKTISNDLDATITWSQNILVHTKCLWKTNRSEYDVGLLRITNQDEPKIKKTKFRENLQNDKSPGLGTLQNLVVTLHPSLKTDKPILLIYSSIKEVVDINNGNTFQYKSFQLDL